MSSERLIYFLIGLLYFAVAGRHKLVLSPEEEFALSQGQHGVNLEAGGLRHGLRHRDRDGRLADSLAMT